MLRFLSTLVLLGVAVALPSFEEALHNNGALRALFRSYKNKEHRLYSSKEAPLRLKLFRSSLEEIVEINNLNLGWTAGFTAFTDMSAAEKALYLGRNATVFKKNLPVAEPEILPAAARGNSRDWVGRAVTAVKNQISQTCWSYSTTHAVEGAYAVTTGQLVEASPQLLIDCVYNGNGYNNGGFQNDALDWLQQNQVIPSWNAYRPFRGTNRCNPRGYQNAMSRVRFGKFIQIRAGEASLVAALNISPTTTNYHVSNWNYHYNGGIYNDGRCRSDFNSLNHAVTAVGYGSDYFKIKNSWGTTWGERGYGRFSRRGNNCGITTDNLRAVVTLAGEEEE